MSDTPAPIKSAAAAAPDDDSVVAVVSLYQKQKKIHPRSVSGLFATWRWSLVWATQLSFYGLPWLLWNDRQALLFDLAARRFYIFGLVLYPQDLIYLTALLMISAYALFLFTAVAGRLWCGFACPQTVYTEIYLWIERRFEGDRAQRIQLDQAPWGWNKLRRKVGKQAAWVGLGLFTGFTFVGYFTPIRELVASLLVLGFGPWEWFWILFYALATYGNAGYLREQVCKYMCPYARFQSAMFDKDTLIITYDRERGEPRGARSKKADPQQLGKGSCVDCGLCVQVCPTGIDIRNGLQYECIGCAACVDVCDGIMDKFGYPRGLVRYATQNSLNEHLGRRQILQRILRPRVLVYSAIMVLVCGLFVASLVSRDPFRVDVVRDRAALARQGEDGQIENVYRLQIMNNAEAPQRYVLRAAGVPGLVLLNADPVAVGPAEARWVTVALRLPFAAAQQVGSGTHAIEFQIARAPAQAGAPAVTLTERSTFMVPR